MTPATTAACKSSEHTKVQKLEAKPPNCSLIDLHLGNLHLYRERDCHWPVPDRSKESKRRVATATNNCLQLSSSPYCQAAMTSEHTGNSQKDKNTQEENAILPIAVNILQT
ncbi:Uncharacterized protein TCM_037227 [Theobroma cacao]|uniref:Uncharacterized protein n=1 Tax=Theobroma cacao TaxID=3641 RepID=A0A061GRQ0_THECC|nr:Uncharacterized protein TCM_037227 [Theobroma cacao]